MKKNHSNNERKENLFKKLFEICMSGSWSIQRDDDDYDDKLFWKFVKCLNNESALRSSRTWQKQPSRGILNKRFRNMQQITGKHPCRSVISIKLLCNFIEIALRRGCSPVNLLYIFRTPFSKNTSGRLLLHSFIVDQQNLKI